MHKYKSLAAWQHSHRLCIDVLRKTSKWYHPRANAVFNQLRRAVVSIETNIVEGYALGTTPQFRRHLRIALGSAAEAECLLTIAVELDLLPKVEARNLSSLASSTIATIYGLLKSNR